MTQVISPIRGAYFRIKDPYEPVPAVAIFSCLPAEHPLYLILEPENPYDEFAIKVLCKSSDFTDEMVEPLNQACGPFGFSCDDLFTKETLHLGYIAKEFAVHLSPILNENEAYLANGNYHCHLSFFTDGKGKLQPQAVIDIEIPT